MVFCARECFHPSIQSNVGLQTASTQKEETSYAVCLRSPQFSSVSASVQSKDADSDHLSGFPVSTSTACSHVLVKLDGWSNTTVFLVLGTVVSGKIPVCLGKVLSTPHLHHEHTETMPETTFSGGLGHRWGTERGMLVFSLIKWIGLWCQPCPDLSWGPSCENTISLKNRMGTKMVRLCCNISHVDLYNLLELWEERFI